MTPDKLELDDIIAIGRTLDEYSRMFDLRFSSLNNTQILDAGGGVSSFTAEACALGLDAKSADRVYKFIPEELEKKCVSDLSGMLSKLPDVRDNYNWDFYGNEAGLKKYREEAYNTFLADYRIHRGIRYINTRLPGTVFTDREFDLTLVSHFLFLYDEHLDYNFHADAIAELIRITREEIRIFPIVNLRWKRSEFVDKIINDPVFSRVGFEIKKVDFEFVRGGCEYLGIRI
jgi:hypothetical protein